MIPFPECDKCSEGFDEEDLKEGLCPHCRGLFQCNCGEWVKKVNPKGLCEKCIPRYITFDSIGELVEHNNYGCDEGELERVRSSVSAIISTLGEIVSCLPKETREKILTSEIGTSFINENQKERIFIKKEDKIK